jgi:hypothetical protein
MELALYSLSRAVESFALCLAEWGWVRHHHVPKRLDVVIFSLATAVIMHCYAQVCERVCILLLSSEAFFRVRTVQEAIRTLERRIRTPFGRSRRLDAL